MATTADSWRQTRDRLGLNIEAKDAAGAITTIHEAEIAGVTQVWMTSGGARLADIPTLYAAAATQTSRVRLGTSIVPIYPRHPLVMAHQALAIHDIAPGRLRLGIGVSHRTPNEQMYGLSMTSSPLGYLREYMAILRGILWEGSVNHHGKFFQVASTLPRQARIPLLVSALGEKAFRVAGEISDGAISWMCPVPYLLKKAIPSFRAGAQAGQRGTPSPVVVAHVPVALSTDMTAAHAAARKRIEGYAKMPFYAHMFAEAGFPVGTDGSGVDALVGALVVVGDESTVRQRLLDLLASGLDELLITPIAVVDEKSERSRLMHMIGSL